jgi:hypothetical protein
MTPAISGTHRRGPRPADDRPDENPDAFLAQDWSAIAVGATVEVTPEVGPPYHGLVDAKTLDSAIVWVVSLSGSTRQMRGNREGVLLRLQRFPPDPRHEESQESKRVEQRPTTLTPEPTKTCKAECHHSMRNKR